MPTTLNYESPSPPRGAHGHLKFWVAFALAGIVGVPFGDWVLESWYHQQHPDGGGLILSGICLILIAGLLLTARALAPSRTKSPLIAIAFGLLGPLIGLVLLTHFVF